MRRASVIALLVVVVQFLGFGLAAGSVPAPGGSSGQQSTKSSAHSDGVKPRGAATTATGSGSAVHGAKNAGKAQDASSSLSCGPLSLHIPQRFVAAMNLPSHACDQVAHQRLPAANNAVHKIARSLREQRQHGPVARPDGRTGAPITMTAPADSTAPGQDLDGLVQPDWKEYASGPPARLFDAMAPDYTTGSTVVFGGINETSSGLLNDTWTGADFHWTQVHPTHSPSVRWGSGTAFDGSSGDVLLFGGANDTAYLGDTWLWNGTDWLVQHPATSPPALLNPQMAWDSDDNEVILFGGLNSSGTLTNQTWAWSNGNWKQLTTTGGPPSARRGGVMAYDNATASIVLYGGEGASSVLGDTWTFSPKSKVWTQQFAGGGTTSPPALEFATGAYDSDSKQIVLFGGMDSGGIIENNTWRYDGTLWTQATGIASPHGLMEASMDFFSSSMPGAPGGSVAADGAVIYGGSSAGNNPYDSNWYSYSHDTPLVTNTVSSAQATWSTGQVVTFEVTVLNPSDQLPIDGNTLSDTLPSGLTALPSVTVNGAACTATTAPSCTVSGSTLNVASMRLQPLSFPGYEDVFDVKAVVNPVNNTLTSLHCVADGLASFAATANDPDNYTDSVLSDHPMAFYPLSDTSTTAKDISVGGAGNGTYSGGVTHSKPGPLSAPGLVPGATASDPAQTSTLFNGSTGKVALPNGFANLSGGVTMEAWVNASAPSPTGYQRIIDLSNASGGVETNEVSVGGFPTLNTLVVTDSVSSTSNQSLLVQDALQPGWQLIAATISNSGKLTLYRNGLPLGSIGGGPQPGNLTRSANAIGAFGGATTGNFNGYIADAAIYPAALSQQRVIAHYDAALAGGGTNAVTETSPVARLFSTRVRASNPSAYWRLDEPAGTTSTFDDMQDSDVESSTGNYIDLGTPTSGVTAGVSGGISSDADSAYQFAGGTGQGVSVADNATNSPNIAPSGAFSLAGWIHPTSTTTAQTILGKSTNGVPNPYVLSLAAGGALKLQVGNGTTVDTASYTAHTVPTTGWSMVVVTVSGTTANFYLDTPSAQYSSGNVTMTGGTVTPQDNTSKPLWIGNTDQGTSPFTGSLDEVAVFPGALQSGDVQSMWTDATTDVGYSQTNAIATTPTGSLIDPTTMCDNDLGLEKYWDYATKDLGSENTAHVNVANGNLVVTADDSTVTAAHGRLALAVRRAYNSEDTAEFPFNGLGNPVGVGWQLNLGQADGLLGAGLGADGLNIDAELGQPLSNPLAVTLIDQDGTRHTFQPAGVTAQTDLSGLLGDPLKNLLHDATNLTVCADVRYTAPAGADMSLWRYVGVNGSCGSGTTQSLAGYVLERPDRLRYVFGAYGQLIAVVDPAGQQLDLVYDEPTVAGVVTGPPTRLRAIYDASDANCNQGQLTGHFQPDAITGDLTEPGGCRWIHFSYDIDGGTCTLQDGAASATCVTDAAGRQTSYELNGADQLTDVINPDGTTVAYSYGTSCAGADGAAPNELCSVTDARGNTSSITYATTTGLPSITSPAPVATITDRDNNPTTFTYRTGTSGLTVDVDSAPSSTVDCTNQTQAAQCERTEYSGIDASGRVATVDQGDASDSGPSSPWLRTVTDIWDTAAAPCQTAVAGAAVVDNDLCTVTDGPSSTTNSQPVTTKFTYTPEGQVLTKTQVMTSGANLVTTYGYHVQYGNGTTTDCVDWNVTGSGTVTKNIAPTPGATDPGCSGTAANPASALYAISDQTQTLSPNGNAATGTGAYQPFMTTREVDDNATAAINSVPTGSLCGSATHPAQTPTSDTGVVCENDAPASTYPSSDAPTICYPSVSRTNIACTLYTYNADGTRATMQTPNSTAGLAGDSGYYTYSYLPDTAMDASCTQSAGGWLQGVTDPTGQFVAYSYDAAGDIIKTWDRDATSAAGKPLSSYQSSNCSTSSISPDNGAAGFTETDYGPFKGFTPPTNGASPSASSPWRWVTSSADQDGDRSDYCYDANGNLLLTRAPRALMTAAMTAADCTAAENSPGKYDAVNFTLSSGVVEGYDRNDQATLSTAPVEGKATGYNGQQSALNSYDAFGNLTSTTDPDGNVVTYSYDRANRKTATHWTRPWDQTLAGTECTPGTKTTSSDAPLPAGQMLCTSSVSYDGMNQVISTTDANNHTSNYTYDAAGRVINTLLPGSAGAALTGYVYDADGNPTTVCSPRDFSSTDGAMPYTNTAGQPVTTSCGSYTALYGATTSYDAADHATSQDRYHVPAGSRDTTPPSLPNMSELTCAAYDPDGNLIDGQHPNKNAATCPVDRTGYAAGYTTAYSYNVLDRASATTTPPSSSGVSTTTAYAYDPSGDLTVTTNPNGINTVDTYDPAHQLTDVVSATHATSLAGVGTADGTANVQTKVRYDADGNVIEQWSPNAFYNDGKALDTGSSASPDAVHLTATVYNADDAATSQYSPRYDTGHPDLGAMPDPQTSDCPANVSLPTDQQNPQASGNSYQQFDSSVGVCLTQASYLPSGRLNKITRPDSVPTTYGYSDDGLVTTITSPDPAGTATDYSETISYDGAGQPIVDATPGASSGSTTQTTITYTPAEQPSSVAAQSGTVSHTTSYVYDAAGDQLSQTDSNTGQQTTDSYYSDGLTADHVIGANVLTLADTTHYAYDQDGNTTAVFSPNAYAAHPSLIEGISYADGTATTDATQRYATLSTYNGNDSLAGVSEPVTVTGSQNVRRSIGYTYDGDGNVLSSKTSENAPNDGGTLATSYYDDDRPHVQTGRDNTTITDSYDADGNLTAAATSAATVPTINAAYFLDDTLASTDDGTQTDTFGYNGAGNLSARQITTDSTHNTVQTSTVTYNSAGLPNAETSDLTTGDTGWTWTYNPAGEMHTQTFGGGANAQTTTDTWANDGTLTEQQTAVAGSPTADWTYTYDGLYRVKTQNYTGTPAAGGGAAPTGIYTYDYNAPGNLDSFVFTPPGGTQQTDSATWDHDGNRLGFGPTAASCTSQGGGGTSSTSCFTYNNDDTVATGTDKSGAEHNYTEDPDGRLSTDGCTQYGYDGFDRMISAATTASTGCSSTSTTSTYKYDGLNRQISSGPTSSPTTTNYDGLSTAIDTESGSRTVNYQLDAGGQPLADESGGTKQLLTTDGNGNITTVSEQSTPATMDCTARFDPFGNPIQGSGATDPTCATGSAITDLSYNAGKRDSTTGTYQLGARTYNPATSAFTTADTPTGTAPAANPAVGIDPLTANTYTYVNGDPLNLTDPSGHSYAFDSGPSDSPMMLDWHGRDDADPAAFCTPNEECGKSNWTQVKDGATNTGKNLYNGGKAALNGLKNTVVACAKLHVISCAKGAAGTVVVVAALAACPEDAGVTCVVLAGAAGGATSGALNCTGSVAECAAKGAALGAALGGVSAGVGRVIGFAKGLASTAQTGDELADGAGTAAGDSDSSPRSGSSGKATTAQPGGDEPPTAQPSTQSAAAEGTGARFVAGSDGTVTDSLGGDVPNAVTLGRYPGYVRAAALDGSKTFNLGDAWEDMAARSDSFGGTGPGSEVWIRNSRFLDEAVGNGSEIRLSSDPLDPANARSAFLDEIEYLQKTYGYQLQGDRMVP